MNASESRLENLETIDGYRQYFGSLDIWTPYLETVCRRQGWGCKHIRKGREGTFPTFIVDDLRVIKFLGPLFDGETSWRVEVESARMLQGEPPFPVARILGSGDLENEPGWHYLIYEYIPGVSMADIFLALTQDAKLAFVCQFGKWLPNLHHLECGPDSNLPHLSADLMKGWFMTRWTADQHRWPARLAGQVEEYISRHAQYLQHGSEIFIHADLTQEHFLGEIENERWTTRAVIDFGDAMQGNLFYELIALHLDLFACDKHLLEVFLENYGFTPDRDFPSKAMVTSLLHQFDVIGYLFNWKPELKKVRSLEELAIRLWKIGD